MLIELFNSNPTLFVLSILIAVMSAVAFFGLLRSDRLVIVSLLALILLQAVFLSVFWSRKADDQIALSSYVKTILDVSGLPTEIEDGLILNDIRWNGLHLANLYSVRDVSLIPDRSFVVSSSCSGARRVSFLALGGFSNINT